MSQHPEDAHTQPTPTLIPAPEEPAADIASSRQQLLSPYDQEHQRYQLLEEIGRGGFGQVSRCVDRFTYRLVASKTLKPQHRDNLAQLRALINESRLVSYLEHPGIVPLYDVYVDEHDNFCYTMKFIEGQPLSEWMRQHVLHQHPFPIAWCLRIFTRICETLSYAHDKGVLHLDIKPANVMLGTYGEVMILDWGSARLFQPERYENYLRNLGQTEKLFPLVQLEDRLVGTPPYMSPEQAKGEKHRLSPASDIFCAGVLFYQILSSYSPFVSSTMQKFVADLFSPEAPLPLHERRIDIPQRLSRIAARMLAKRPEDRYQNFREVLQDIQDFQNQGSDFEVRTYDTGEIIFREGDIGEYACQIIDGLVEISVHVDGIHQVLAIQGRGEVIGELSIFTNRPRTATIKALQPTTLRLLTAQTINQELEKLNPWVGHMIYRLSQKFIDLSQQLTGSSSDTIPTNTAQTPSKR